MSPSSARAVHLSLLLVAVSAFLVVVLEVLSKTSTTFALLEPIARALTACPYRSVTREPCPLCGTVTALVLLAQGELGKSLAANPLGFGLLPLGLSQVVYRALRAIWPRLSLKEELAVDSAGIIAATALTWLGPRLLLG